MYVFCSSASPLYLGFVIIYIIVLSSQLTVPSFLGIPALFSSSAIFCRLFPVRYALNTTLTILASFSTIFQPSAPFLNPYGRQPCLNVPRLIRLFIPILTFCDNDIDSVCAIELSAVISVSPFINLVLIPSFSKMMSTPIHFNSLIVVIESYVFLANLEMDFVMTKSIFPRRQSSSILTKSSLLFISVPVIPLSA